MSDKIKVVVTDHLESDLDWEAEEMARRGVDFECHQLKTAGADELVRVTRDADVVVVNMAKITAAVVAGWEKCRLVIRHGAGYDNVDVEALTKRGIVLEYLPDCYEHEVSEQAIAMILACARKITWSKKVFDASVARGQWDYSSLGTIFRLHGATVGIVGCGRIGSQVHHKMAGFGVKFLVYDPYLSPQRKSELGVEPVDLKSLCQGSDFVTLHTPLGKETRHMINAESLSWMKKTAYLINTSRGGMIDHEALAGALRSRQIAGAAIDVYENEPPAPDFCLLGLDNVLLTPHISWYSKESEWGVRKKIMQDIGMFLDGTGPRMPVNPEALTERKVT